MHTKHCVLVTIRIQLDIIRMYLLQGLPGFEPGSKDSESLVIANYTTGPQICMLSNDLYICPYICIQMNLLGARIELATLGLWDPRATNCANRALVMYIYNGVYMYIGGVNSNTYIHVYYSHCGARTHDHLIKSQALYQTKLSGIIAPVVGIEPTANSLKGCRSTVWATQALYMYIIVRQPGIEPGPHRWQRRILTVELLALTSMYLCYLSYWTY